MAKQTSPQSLSEKIVYHDSIGDVEIACQRLESKIDTLYDEMNSFSVKWGRELDSTIVYAKANYKQVLQANADIYRQIYDKGTAGGSASNLYYYYQLCDYYPVVRELHGTLVTHFKQIHEEGLDTLDYYRY